jgi:hypothetical protein
MPTAVGGPVSTRNARLSLAGAGAGFLGIAQNGRRKISNSPDKDRINSPLAGGWLSGRYRTGNEGPYSAARQRLANRFDMSLPENQRKLEAAGQLAALADKAGITLIEMAIAFVLRHPAISSALHAAARR